MGIISSVAGYLGLSKVVASASAGILVIIINLLISKFKLKEKFRGWINKAKVSVNTWFSKITNGTDMMFYNAGIWITGLPNNVPWLDKIWNNAIEPFFIMLLEFISEILVTIAEMVINIITSGFKKLIQGLKSDNKNYNKNNKE